MHWTAVFLSFVPQKNKKHDFIEKTVDLLENRPAVFSFFKIFVFSTRTLASEGKVCYNKTVANLQGSTKTVHMEDCRKE